MNDNVARLAPTCHLAVVTTPRFRSAQGTSVRDAGPVWMPPMAAVGAFQRHQNVPATAVLINGVLAGVCPGHRSWSPPV